MTQSFDDWYDNNEHYYKHDALKYAYKVGAQFRQEEVFKLQSEFDELRGMIDEALSRLNNTYPENWGYEVTCAIGILKGNQDD